MSVLLFGSGGFLEAVGPAELLGELVDAAGGVDKLLLACEEWMAVATDIDVDLRHCTAGHKRVAAGAVDGAGLVLGMNLGFHGRLLVLPDVRDATIAETSAGNRCGTIAGSPQTSNR